MVNLHFVKKFSAFAHKQSRSLTRRRQQQIGSYDAQTTKRNTNLEMVAKIAKAVVFYYSTLLFFDAALDNDQTIRV